MSWVTPTPVRLSEYMQERVEDAEGHLVAIVPACQIDGSGTGKYPKGVIRSEAQMTETRRRIVASVNALAAFSVEQIEGFLMSDHLSKYAED